MCYEQALSKGTQTQSRSHSLPVSTEQCATTIWMLWPAVSPIHSKRIRLSINNMSCLKYIFCRFYRDKGKMCSFFGTRIFVPKCGHSTRASTWVQFFPNAKEQTNSTKNMILLLYSSCFYLYSIFVYTMKMMHDMALATEQTMKLEPAKNRLHVE